MIVHIIDEKLRNDISVVLNVVGPDRNKLEITIDQQRPPCADMTMVGKYTVDLPPEVKPEDYPAWG